MMKGDRMIKTERLTLRPFEQGDKDFLYQLNNHKEVNKYRSRDTDSLENCIHSIDQWNNRYGEGLLNVYLIELNESHESIGMMALFKNDPNAEEVEIGYRMLTDYWGKGYNSESMQALIDTYEKKNGACKIVAETDPENLNSIKLLERNGFVEEKHSLENRGKFFILNRSGL